MNFCLLDIPNSVNPQHIQNSTTLRILTPQIWLLEGPRILIGNVKKLQRLDSTSTNLSSFLKDANGTGAIDGMELGWAARAEFIFFRATDWMVSDQIESRPRPRGKWAPNFGSFLEGKSPGFSGKWRLVKYYNLARRYTFERYKVVPYQL